MKDGRLNRRSILLGGTTLAAASALVTGAPIKVAQAQQPAPSGRRPNILVIFGDDIGQANISAYSHGVMGYRTPNIDRLAKEGMMFTDYYAGRSGDHHLGSRRRGPVLEHVQRISAESATVEFQHRSGHAKGAAELRGCR